MPSGTRRNGLIFTLHRHNVLPIIILLTNVKILVASELIRDTSALGHK